MTPYLKSGNRVGAAWLALSLALALHVLDEALTGFLEVYNPTVLALRERFAWFPMPVFEFWPWLLGLLTLIAVLLLLTPFALRNRPAIRPVAYLFAAIMLVNGLGHTAGTIAGRTVETVRFERPMPGFYSSPFLLLGSVWLLAELRRSRRDGTSVIIP